MAPFTPLVFLISVPSERARVDLAFSNTASERIDPGRKSATLHATYLMQGARRSCHRHDSSVTFEYARQPPPFPASVIIKLKGRYEPFVYDNPTLALHPGKLVTSRISILIGPSLRMILHEHV
jgi:hypothetical protein